MNVFVVSVDDYVADRPRRSQAILFIELGRVTPRTIVSCFAQCPSWERTDTNLQAGMSAMIFSADRVS